MGGSQSKEPEPGDLIEISRGAYKHWAVYVGDGYVIHLTVPDGVSGVSASSVPSVRAKNGVVKKEPLSKVVEGCKYRISQKYDKKYNRRPFEEILRDAEAKVGEQVDYNLFSNNCEHFATGLTHGVYESKQVDDAILGGGIGIGVMAVTGIAVGTGMALKSGREERK